MKHAYHQTSRKNCYQILSECKTIQASRLLVAAIEKSNSMLFSHLIYVKDLVAAEAKYYKPCYQNYTQFLIKATEFKSVFCES